MSKRQSPSFREVAEYAGVSLATVSRVASGRGGVSPEVEAKVRAAAVKLGAILDPREKSQTIAFLPSNRDLLHPIHSRIFVGAESFCRTQGWELVLQTFQYDENQPAKEIRLPRLIERGGAIRAVILAGVNTAALLARLDAIGMSYAVLGNNLAGDWDPSAHDVVYMDDLEGAREMTRYLLSLGHRDIWFIGDVEQPWAARLLRGYRTVMEETGLTPRWHGMHSDERQTGYLCAKLLISRREPATAIFAASDPTAEGVIRALRDSGVRVPEEISVAGVNDTEGAILHPPLTTIRSFPEEVGRHLAELVINRIAKPELPGQQLTIPTQLIRRESCRVLAATASALV